VGRKLGVGSRPKAEVEEKRRGGPEHLFRKMTLKETRETTDKGKGQTHLEEIGGSEKVIKLHKKRRGKPGGQRVRESPQKPGNSILKTVSKRARQKGFGTVTRRVKVGEQNGPVIKKKSRLKERGKFQGNEKRKLGHSPEITVGGGVKMSIPRK